MEKPKWGGVSLPVGTEGSVVAAPAKNVQQWGWEGDMFLQDGKGTCSCAPACGHKLIAAAPQGEVNPPVSQQKPPGDPGKSNKGGQLHDGDSVHHDGEPQLPKICFCCLPSNPQPTSWCDLLTETGICPNFDSAFTDKVCCTFNFNDGTSSCVNLGPAAANPVGADSIVNSVLSGVGTVVDGLLKGLQ
ncbi:uncharacterized protein CDV56_103180 [Aspergillus thermomutatus]|uniref:Uncharacterized protein n=1 Tax=Aspergillus thermomutatus TaxID=41047 RepID=A0A397GWY7_ASPTH|nr:uncharacterized protein CDV56_103180 [Aspergillus thermomutatus]RHZ55157.1 hypothetical protein CDV56_103180 [Aspergillus thermomutatus]